MFLCFSVFFLCIFLFLFCLLLLFYVCCFFCVSLIKNIKMPNCENPAQIMRSWNLQGTFASGEVKYNKLVPQPWKRIDTLFLQTWREETVSNVLDWGAQNFSFYLPESLRVLSSMYLEIQLPALSGGGTYKAFPALYVIDRLRFLTVCTMIPSGSPLPARAI